MISVDGLVAVPSLGLTYLAGETGGTKLVTWAHACDLSDPWEWFKTGDLVMTTGGGLPIEEADQAQWIIRLIDSGVSGLVIAPEPNAPAVTDALIAAANDRNFPVLSASFNLQFVTLARTVIESAVESERQRLTTIKRLYDVYWQSLHARGSFVDRISALEGTTGWALEVRDSDAGESIARGREATRALASAGRQADPVEIPIPGVGSVVLVAGPGRTQVQDRPLLQHVGGLIALELEHHAAQRDHLRAAGEDLLLGLLDGTISVSALWPELRHRGMTGTVVAACWTVSPTQVLIHDYIHRDARLQHCAPLMTFRDNVLISIVPNDSDLLLSLAKKMNPAASVGISAPLKINSDVAETVRQAHIAAARALESAKPLLSYDAGDRDTGLFPHSVEDTRRLVQRILGPLVTYDTETNSELVNSVRVFLRNDGNWQRSSEELGIHRQTLVYRLRKVEQLTGLKSSSTHGSSRFWLALEAADRAHLPLSDLLN